MRLKVNICVAAAGLLLSSSVPAASARPAELMKWPDLLNRKHPAPNATIKYGSDPLQVVDVWIPRGRGLHPTVLMVHGGCWQTDIADRHIMDWIANDLRRRGIAVWNIDYRGIDRTGGGFPGTFTDVAAAADALRQHAREYRLDTRRVVAVGHSAGGHLALWLAGRPRLPANSALRTSRPLLIASVVSLGGLPDLELAGRVENGCGTDAAGKLASGHFTETSIPRLAPLRVPQRLVNGLQDKIIPNVTATDYRRKMRAAGDDVRVRWVGHSGHVELIAPETSAWAAAVAEIRAAFRK